MENLFEEKVETCTLVPHDVTTEGGVIVVAIYFVIAVLLLKSCSGE